MQIPTQWFLSQMFPERGKCQVSLKGRKIVMLSKWPVIAEEVEFGLTINHSNCIEVKKKLKMNVPLPWQFKHCLNNLREDLGFASG